MTKFLCLSPDEIEHILDDDNLDVQDVINLSSTCSYVRDIIQKKSNQFWQNKFFLRWPTLMQYYNANVLKDTNFLKEAKSLVRCKNKIRQYMQRTLELYYGKEDLTLAEMEDLQPLFCPEKGAHPRGYIFLIDELMNAVSKPLQSCNLTYTFYAKKMLTYTRHCYLRKEWQRINSLPYSNRTFETIAIFIAQWYQPMKNIASVDVSSRLEDIKQEALRRLQERNPEHPVLKATEEQFIVWRENNISNNEWDSTEVRQIMEILRILIFNEFDNASDNVVISEIKDMCIDIVFKEKKGHVIILMIIFEALARRLGVRCNVIVSEFDFYLHWEEKRRSGNVVLSQNRYMEFPSGSVSNNIEEFDNLLVQGDNALRQMVLYVCCLLEYSTKYFDKLDTTYVQYRWVLELQHLIDPYNIQVLVNLNEYYEKRRMDYAELIVMFESILENWDQIVHRNNDPSIEDIRSHIEMLRTESHPQIEWKSNERMPGMKYTVGMIVNFFTAPKGTCVIIGWNRNNLFKPCGSNNSSHPLYTVLCENGAERYVPENSIKVVTESSGNHIAFARYFERFAGTHYVPNKTMARLYPEDINILQHFFDDYQNSSDNR